MPTPTYMTAERPTQIVRPAARTAARPVIRASTARLIEYVLVAITASAGSWFVFELVRYLTAR